MPIKITIIGAGSIGFARRLFRDIVVVPELADAHFALHDINKRNLDMAEQMFKKDIEANHLAATLSRSLDRRRAVEGAHYVINCTRIGGLDAFKTDIEIPLKYGIDQCVGDTLCAGGIMYGMRNVAAILDFCKDIREVAAPNALLLNYANPMAINTWAAIQYGKVKTIGLCHGVEGGWHLIAKALGVNVADLDGTCAGINHQTWYTDVRCKGKTITPEKLLAAMEKHPVISKDEKCRIDVLRRFGAFSTESNGHLSEYLPWYRKRANEIDQWISLDRWILGETGGYLRVCTEGRNWFVTDFPKMIAAQDEPITMQDRSHERGSFIIESLETGKKLKTYVNVENNGYITNLPADAIVEVPAFVDRVGIHPVTTGDLPLACAATCQASIDVQRMAVEAAVHGDVTLLKQAMLHDPLTGAVCNPPEVWQMVDEMLVAQAKWLPQFKRAIAPAKKRLTKKTVKTKKWVGAARLKTRSVAELKREKRQLTIDAGDRDNLKTGTRQRLK